ncbi:hypothetical protein [Leptolyngbya sp. CCY15150]|uniref:hypothetical protein n=1 Tax=Leptolyngbya sp. CCY15150 TaxID=2767772 RepID=UPI00194F0EC8|nr:hypothetical protein [Leptolyngbya sp. CCY15150]
MTTGPYQSRILNQLTQNYRRLRDDLQLNWRKSAVAMVWGVQVLLYPFYVATQTTRVLGRQLRQTVRRVLPQLGTSSPPPTADTPLQATLRSLPSLDLPAIWEDDLELPSDPAQAIPDPAAVPEPHPPRLQNWLRSLISRFKPAAPLALPAGRLYLQQGETTQVIQGLACQVTSQALVLVGSENSVVDCLTPEQQTRLQHRMVLALADYYHQQRIYAPPTQGLALPMTDDRVLPPMRWMNQAIAWMQTGPVAIAANLFQEAQALPERRIPRPQRSPWQTLRTFWNPETSALVPTNPTPDPAASWGLRYEDWETHGPTAPTARIAPGWITPYQALQPTQPSPAPLQTQQPASLHTDAPASPDSPAESLIYSQPSGVDPGEPDWIETDALVMGYVKHPLEQVLEWLDLSMVWLEERATSLWHWVQTHVQRSRP